VLIRFIASSQILLTAAALLAGGRTWAQDLMQPAGGGSVVLFNSDMAVFESGDRRRDLPCEVKAIKPQLGFDLSYHAGYTVTVPRRELATSREVVVITRVASTDKENEPSYFIQKMRTGEATDSDELGGFHGVFNLGEGSYRLDWLMRDSLGRFCSDSWEIGIEPLGKNRGSELAIQPGQIKPARINPFNVEPLPAKEYSESLPPVKVLLNFAPVDPTASALSPAEVHALLSMLRNIARDPRIGRLSLAVFNLDQRKILYEQENTIDFEALGRELESLKLGTVEFANLVDGKNGTATFLASLLEAKPETATNPTYIFIGPTDGVPDDFTLEATGGEMAGNVLYLNYNPDPTVHVWGDAISRVVKFFKGRKYVISQPRDLLAMWPDFISRLRR
jgi:hypothetical protein